MNKGHRSKKLLLRDNIEQIRKDTLQNSFVDDLELIEESQEYDLILDCDPMKCMECPEVFLDWSDLSDHMRKVHRL